MITSKMILDCIPDGVFTIDADGHILNFNKGAEAITGFSEEDVLGKQCMKIFQTQLCQSLCPLKLSLKTRENVANFEIEITHKNGKQMPISVSTAVLRDSAGRILGGVETFRNISEVKKLRDHIERVSRLRSLAIVAAGVAHEIRNPLAAIRTNLEYMREDVPSDFAHIEGLDDSIIEISRANEIIKRLVDFAKPEKTSKANIDINELMDSVLESLAIHFQKNKIHVDKHLTSNLPQFVADPHYLRTAFINIITNSLDAMPTGGTLLVETIGEFKTSPGKGIHLSLSEKSKDWQFLRIIIQDSGTGIPKEHLGHVFEPFYSTKNDGIGLGLSISHQAIEQHGGTMDIQSETGSGTKISIRLPLLAND
ncbi:nitrogen regulation protein NR(II) [Planctomycetota bacterium]